MRELLDSLDSLLPPNSTALEKNLLKVTGFDNYLDPGIGQMQFAKGYWRGWSDLADPRGLPIRDADGNFFRVFDGKGFITDSEGQPILDESGEYIVDENWPQRLLPIDPSFLRALEIEYGSFYLEPFIADPATRILSNFYLKRKRGTPQAVKRVLEWVGFPDAAIVEETEPTRHFPEYQLYLDRVPTREEVCSITNVVRVAQPLRSRLRRIVSGWDIPRFVLDGSDWGDILSNYSGEPVGNRLTDCPEAANVIVSIRRFTTIGKVKVTSQAQISHETIPV